MAVHRAVHVILVTLIPLHYGSGFLFDETSDNNSTGNGFSNRLDYLEKYVNALTEELIAERNERHLLQQEVQFLQSKTNQSDISLQKMATILTAEKKERQTLQQEVQFLQLKTNQSDISFQNMTTILKNIETEVQHAVLSIVDVDSKETSDVRKIMDHLTKLETNISKNILKLNSNISSISATLHDMKNGKVGFTAGVNSSSTTWSSGTLVFSKILSNVGGGYNERSGVFTAPVGGNYVFYVTIVPYGSYNIYVDIVLNGISKVRTISEHGSGSYNQVGTNMVFLSLKQGDRVWVKHYSGKGYITHPDTSLTTFSGFLL